MNIFYKLVNRFFSKETALALVNADGSKLETLTDIFKNDPDVVLSAVKQDGHLFKYASLELRNDYVFTQQVISIYPQALFYASVELQHNEDLLIYAITKNYLIFQDIDPIFRKHKLIVLTALSQNGESLLFADAIFKDDKAMVLVAVSKNGRSLQYASDTLRNDRDIVLAAVTQYGSALASASADLQNDKELVLSAIKQDGMALKYASPQLQNEIDIVTAAVSNDGNSIRYASDTLRNNLDIVKLAVTQNGSSIGWAPSIFRANKQIMLAAISQDGYAFRYALQLQDDLELVLSAVYQTTSVLTSLKLSIFMHPAVLFTKRHRTLILEEDWPLIKRALLEKQNYFLNPEPYMKSLLEDMEYPYVILAHYALSKDAIIKPEPYPELNTNV